MTLLDLLHQVKNGQCSVDDAFTRLQKQPQKNLEGICLDHQRTLRTGIPEVIYGASKSSEQIIAICTTLTTRNETILVTRIDAEKAKIVQDAVPNLHYHEAAQILSGNEKDTDNISSRGTILVICAGTSDIPVAEEAVVTIKSLGHPVEKLYDVGVAGLHRILDQQTLLATASVIIVVAGMEGALPSVVGGLSSAPVIGVPTSIGYGANLGGFSALLGMLNSCAPGLAVVNIDNGFGAACMAMAINKRLQQE